MNANIHTGRMPAEERKAATVRAVVELAANRNPAEITTTEVAERMHVTQGSLFRHFPSKDAIWEAVVEWVAERLMKQVKRAAASSRTSEEALGAVFMAHMGFALRHPGAPRIVFGELQRAGDSGTKRVVRLFMARYSEFLHELIEQGKTEEWIHPGTSTMAAVALFIGAVQGLTIQMLLNRDRSQVELLASEALELYLRGIRMEA